MIIKKKSSYIPLRIDFPANHPFIVYAQASSDVFQASFLHHGIELFKKEGLLTNHQTLPIDSYLEFINNQNTIDPTGFIFHVSRCGSTLVKKMLDGIEGSRNIAEPGLVNRYLISTFFGDNWTFHAEVFRAIILGYLIDNQKELKYATLKFTSWAWFFYPYFKMAFPEVPILFLFRDPLEVIVSTLNGPDPASHFQTSFPEMAAYLTNKSITQVQNTDRLYYLAENIYNAMALSAENSSDLILNLEYPNIKDGFFQKLLPHFKVDISDQESKKIQNITTYYSKSYKTSVSNEQTLFQSDSREKLDQVTTEMIDVIDKFDFDAIRRRLKNK